jgi:ferric-dicitrate binding protein FerR (iron transport regulator)
MNEIRAFRFLLAVLLLLGLMAGAQAAEVGKVTRLAGSADITRGGAPARLLQAGDAIEMQDIVRTKSNSSLEITLSDGSRLTLGEDTRVNLAEFITGAEPAGLLELTRGTLRAFVTDLFSSRRESFRVRTPTAVAGVQGTDFAVSVKALLTQLIVYQGVVVVSSVDPRIPQRETVRAGQFTLIKQGEPPEPARGLPPTAFGSGGTLDLRAGGEQGREPSLLIPNVPSSIPTPPIPRPPLP